MKKKAIKKNIFKFIKNNRYALKLCIVFFVILSFFTLTRTYSKYVINSVYDKFLKSKGFYYYSSILNGETYDLNDWNGKNDYSFSVDIMNYIDELRWTKEDIPYEVNVSCNPSVPGDVTCTASNGTINYNAEGGTANRINITLSNPNSTVFSNNDTVEMNLSITSTDPFRKTLSATFNIIVKEEKVTYRIKDNANQPFFDLLISNYSNTSESVTLSWDYTIINVDGTDSNILSGVNRTTIVNNVTFVNGNTFSIAGKKSISIRFYKMDKTANYTYPITNPNSIVTVS